ncbi:hypothetical protein CKK33_06900 [Mucilaginibacter sp. MD40]|uniref:hypothetical protein n=1 Tax=Mucilaginibacter sp. MD40 TaxID=2029590 RepID=UPI000BAC8188|nr:hypothetical protein [Mucilaginibacter sp. MD40]PAW93240.1 hypothetical protein CKK33_06900 [Mucilaginibacter sp. MD40]
MRLLLVVLMVCCTLYAAQAQSSVQGKVMEYQTRIALRGVSIENINNHHIVANNADGSFSILAKPGDLVIFKAPAYQPDTLLITGTRSVEVFLQPVTHMLNGVNVTSTTTSNMSTYYDPQFHGQPVVYARDKDLNLKGGIVWRIHYWKKDQKKKDKIAALEQRYALMEQIDSVFQPENLSQYITLGEADMKNFIALYTPTPEMVTSKKFDLVTYLNDCLKQYRALPPEKRQPPPDLFPGANP